MALQFIDRVRVTTSTTGTGPITIGAAVSGFVGFGAMTVNNTAYYIIEDLPNWETGVGTLGAGGIWNRTTVSTTSAGTTAPIALSGSAQLFISLTAAFAQATTSVPSLVPVTTIATSGTAQTLRFPADGSNIAYDITLTAACVLTIAGGLAGKDQSMKLYIRNGTTGGFGWSVSNTVVWPNSAPPVNTAANFVFQGTLSTHDASATVFGFFFNPVIPHNSESPDRTSVTGLFFIIMDAVGNYYSYNNQNQVCINGIQDASTAALSQIYYRNHLVYHHGNFGNWYVIQTPGAGWTLSADPTGP